MEANQAPNRRGIAGRGREWAGGGGGVVDGQ